MDTPSNQPMKCEEIATTINRLVKAGHIAKAQELLELSLEDYFVLQLAMFADKKVNAYTTIAAWKQAGLRLPAEDTPEFYPYGDSPSVTEEQPKTEVDKPKEEMPSTIPVKTMFKLLIDLPLRFIFALIAFTFGGWGGWLGIVLVLLKVIGVIHWQWWVAALPLEYGVVYCLYMTIDGALYRAGLKDIGGYARFTQGEQVYADLVAQQAQEVKQTQGPPQRATQDSAVKLGCYYRFHPNMNSIGGFRLEKDPIDLTPGDIVKVVTTPKDGIRHVNKPGKCPVIATMELVPIEWLEAVKTPLGGFKECEYCAAINHETSDCPYRGKVPYGWKGTGPWRIEGGKMFFD
jgi:hypothetical protein